MIKKNAVIYEVYIRNHSQRGDFEGLIQDLPRIKDLGVDYVWLMPIYPIGQIARKGIHGSPYSIADYLSINPEYGCVDDFMKLAAAIHNLHMGVAVDLVFNHTAHDSILAKQHNNWFKYDDYGNPTTTVPEWSDIIELDYSHIELHDYMLSVVERWVSLGIDGFRCDVASLVPLDFWVKARQTATRINPNVFWLAESIQSDWVAERRKKDLFALSDSELYQTFDITYDYDIYAVFENVLMGKLDVAFYLDILNFQDAIYPKDFIKLRYVENHDTERIMSLAPSRPQALAWTALQVFNKGWFLIYAGQESGCDHKPSHFEKEPIDWGNYELTDFLRRLTNIKKHPAIQTGKLFWVSDNPLVMGIWYSPEKSLVGLFNTRASAGLAQIPLDDGFYQNMISDKTIHINENIVNIPNQAAIFECHLTKPPVERKTLLV